MSPVRPWRAATQQSGLPSPSNINANHCSHSINMERKVQFTSDLFLMNLDGFGKNCDEYSWIERTFSETVKGHTVFSVSDFSFLFFQDVSQ